MGGCYIENGRVYREIVPWPSRRKSPDRPQWAPCRAQGTGSGRRRDAWSALCRTKVNMRSNSSIKNGRARCFRYQIALYSADRDTMDYIWKIRSCTDSGARRKRDARDGMAGPEVSGQYPGLPYEPRPGKIPRVASANQLAAALIKTSYRGNATALERRQIRVSSIRRELRERWKKWDRKRQMKYYWKEKKKERNWRVALGATGPLKTIMRLLQTIAKAKSLQV